jgi:hypothetical protein
MMELSNAHGKMKHQSDNYHWLSVHAEFKFQQQRLDPGKDIYARSTIQVCSSQILKNSSSRT